MVSPELFDVSPSEGLTEGNPFRAIIATVNNFESAYVRITPPVFLNEDAVSMACDVISSSTVKVAHDAMSSTPSATMIDLYIKEIDLSEIDGEAVTETSLGVMVAVVQRLIDRLGATENENLFKKYIG
jgi:hypothetical protein